MKSDAQGAHWLLFIAWLVALFAMLFSLYSSEVLGMFVCHLCWYQRVCLFPLVLILGIGAFNGDIDVVRYAIGLPIIGCAFAIYQYLEQMIPGFSPINICSVGGDCSVIHFKWLGFITFPLLSVFACAIIILLLCLARSIAHRQSITW